ncbi:PolC-type DNA polymerase III [Bacillus mycoides]|uniref:Exonuclease RNase T and DNA polymerase III n=1 Tax=Bacillus mycoides (strain KBAB4) TaxID=315730 RepID=A9VVI2_BACMK|nr:3'-5' exonuclease [Bacillus mycoides]ABY46797.1 Exonuclease RNase T and DNA polymerase III [Bacillus mycoides KBAB4]
MNNVLAQPQAKEIFTVFDLETTGLDYKNEQVVEIAAIRTDLEQELGRMHILVKLNEGKKLPDFLVDNTDLRDYMLVNGMVEHQALINLMAFMGNSIVVAHYAPFDFAYLFKALIAPELFLCTRSIERLLTPDKSASLAPTAERRGVKLEGAHRAMNDIEATIGVLKSQLSEIKERGIKRSVVQNMIVDSPERPNKFTPRHAKVKTSKEFKLVGKKVKITQTGNDFGKVGVVLDAYINGKITDEMDGTQIVIIRTDEGDELIKYAEHTKVVK